MCEFNNGRSDKVLAKESFERGTNAILEAAESQLTEYFAGKRTDFDLELDLMGTEFQKKVWTELLNINYGSTSSYLEQAKKLGDVKAIRAMASANGKNKISIIVPCHRVIGSNGDLVGYGGGKENKKWLLDFESNQLSLF